MSDFAEKNYSGLMEAYASIYQQLESVVEENVDEVCFEDLEVDTDIMVDLVVDRLIAEGYANTNDQALNMIPHMSDAWLDTVVGNFVLEESFIDAVNSVVEEGYDLSSYTVNELFDDYIGHFNNYLTEDHHMDLHEVVPLLAAPLLANPATWAAGAGLAAGAAYAGKKALDAYRQMRSGTSAEGERWLQQGVLQAKTKKPAQDQRRLQQAKERLQQRQQQPAAQQPAAQAKPAPAQPASGGTPAAGPTPPKPPKGPNFFQRLGQAFKQSTAQRAAQKAAKPPGPSGPSGPSPRMQKATDILTHPFTKGAAATFTGTSVLGDIRGGGQGLRTIASLPVGAIGGGTKAIGYLSGSEGIKQTGRDIEKLGSSIRGGEQQAPASVQKPEAPKQKKLKFGPDGSVIGLE